jgi:hypothetical protein
MIQTNIVPFEKEKIIEICLFDKNENIYFNADYANYYSVSDDFIFKNCILVGTTLTKKGRYVEHVIKFNPTKKDMQQEGGF